MPEKSINIKRIKSLRICDSLFNVKWDCAEDGGWFDYGKRIICIGTKTNTDCQILSIIIHELKEIIQVNQYTRYTRPDTEKEYEFHYNHKEHSTLCCELAGCLKEFLK